MNTIFKVIIIIAGLLGLVLLGTFIYDKYSGGGNATPSPTPSGGQLPVNVTVDEEKKLKEFAGNFVRIYKTYQLGDFSGLESLQSQMTARLWQEKSDMIASAKLETEKQPKRYVTYSAFIKSSVIVSNTRDKADVEVSCVQREMKGAMIQGDITIKYVNEFGEDKPIPPATESIVKVILHMVKENNEWKVDQIK